MSIGIDVGGTKIVGVKIKNMEILERVKMNTSNGTVISTLSDILSYFQDDIVGIGVPCYLNKGVCIKAPHISELDGLDLKKVFNDAVIVNDCTAMAYGEYVLRDEKYESLLLVALGTGVGSGLVFKGIPYHGRGSAMELGHIKGFSDKKCFCGKEGCLETVLGGKYEDLKNIEIQARKGSFEARTYMKNYGKILGRGLSYVIELLDPEIVVFGGSVSNAFDLFIEPLKEELRKLLSFIDVDDIIFERAKSSDSGAIGAALIAERKLM